MKQRMTVRLLIVFSILLAGSFIMNSSANLVSDGLVAYYPFNSNADDASGNGLNGTVHGAQLTIDRFGNADSAYQFDGLNDYISVTENSAFTVTDVTVAAWVKTSDKSDMVHITSCYDRAWNDSAEWYNLYLTSGSGEARWQVDRGGLTPPPVVIGTNDVADGEWHFVVGVRDTSSTELLIYVDGELEAVKPDISVDELDPMRDFWIGGQHDFSNRYLDGAIDDVSVYSRALSAAEINTLYEAIPEPASLSLMGLVTGGLYFARRFFLT